LAEVVNSCTTTHGSTSGMQELWCKAYVTHHAVCVPALCSAPHQNACLCILFRCLIILQQLEPTLTLFGIDNSLPHDRQQSAFWVGLGGKWYPMSLSNNCSARLPNSSVRYSVTHSMVMCVVDLAWQSVLYGSYSTEHDEC